jgi:hypothetical protein
VQLARMSREPQRACPAFALAVVEEPSALAVSSCAAIQADPGFWLEGVAVVHCHLRRVSSFTSGI